MRRPKKQRHNPFITDLVISYYIFLRWTLWMVLLTRLFGMEQRRAARITRMTSRLCFSWWLGRIMRLTVYRERQCFRTLRYIGYRDFPDVVEGNDTDSVFEIGKTYSSLTFNGGTYTIKGHDGRIGYAFVEIVD